MRLLQKHFESSIDLEKSLKTQKASFFDSFSSHFLVAQLFIKINFPNGYSSACSLSFFLLFLVSVVFLLSVRLTSDRARLSSLSIVIRYFSITYAAHSTLPLFSIEKKRKKAILSFLSFTVN